MERLIYSWVVLLGAMPFNASAQQKIAVEDVSMEIETTAEREHWCYNVQDFVSNSDGVDCHTLDMRHSVSIKEGQFIIDEGMDMSRDTNSFPAAIGKRWSILMWSRARQENRKYTTLPHSPMLMEKLKKRHAISAYNVLTIKRRDVTSLISRLLI